MIKNLTVYVDAEPLPYTQTIRCGFIVAENEDGEETYHNDLIDDSEYPSIRALIDDVAGIFRISREAIVVTG